MQGQKNIKIWYLLILKNFVEMVWSFVWELHYVIQTALLQVLTTQTGNCPVTMCKINTYFQKLEVLVSDLRSQCSDEYRNDLFWHRKM